MDKLAIELKNAYNEAAKKMLALEEQYKHVEKVMEGKNNEEEKLTIAQNFDMNYKTIKSTRKEIDNAISKIGTEQERDNLTENNVEVKAAFDYYLWHDEEVFYVYPHAQSAVAVFLRDNVLVK